MKVLLLICVIIGATSAFAERAEPEVESKFVWYNQVNIDN